MAEVNGHQANGNHANGSAAAGVNGSAKGPEANGFVKKPVVDMAVALRPNDLPGVPEIVKSISSLSTAAVDGDEGSRLELVEKARDLVRSLETPRETMIKHCWAQPAVFTALTVGVDIGLFTALAEDNGSPKAAQALAKKLHVDPPLLSRLMRHTATMGYIKEVGPDTYKPTSFTSSLTIPEIGAGYPCLSGGLLGSVNKFPEYAIKNGYKTPNDISNGCLQHAYNTEKNMFEHLHANPPYGLQFNHHMGGYRQGRPSWMDKGFYPVQERLIDGFDSDPNAALLVDVGGGMGHDLDEFRRKNPDAPGRLILQDLNTVLGQITDLDSKIERMEYDFYTEQPLKGARAYYMHSVLHDWPDEVAAKILARIKEAMKPGYSRLLINENVIPPEKAQWEATALDIMMLTLLSSRERTQDDWEHLVQEMAGLRINKIYTTANGVESIVECELVE